MQEKRAGTEGGILVANQWHGTACITFSASIGQWGCGTLFEQLRPRALDSVSYLVPGSYALPYLVLPIFFNASATDSCLDNGCASDHHLTLWIWITQLVASSPDPCFDMDYTSDCHLL